MLGAWLAAGMTVACAANSPAQLREGEASIESNLHVPEGLAPRRYDVHCEARIRKDGKPYTLICYALDPAVPQKLASAVRSAGMHSRFIPATQDGEPTEVFMQVMVRIVVGDGRPLVLAVPNDGAEEAKYGLLYTAPQLLKGVYWRRGFRNGTPGEDWIWQELWIDDHGSITKHSLTNASGVHEAVIRDREHLLERMQFIPGFFEGKPVPMRLKQPVNVQVPWLKTSD